MRYNKCTQKKCDNEKKKIIIIKQPKTTEKVSDDIIPHHSVDIDFISTCFNEQETCLIFFFFVVFGYLCCFLIIIIFIIQQTTKRISSKETLSFHVSVSTINNKGGIWHDILGCMEPVIPVTWKNVEPFSVKDLLI